jgi:hypothetical protein
MKVFGFCTGCKRIRRVHVTPSSVAFAQASNTVVAGLCDDCQDAKEKR